MRVIEVVLSDRGSKYAVSGGPVAGRTGSEDFVKALTARRKFARATHHSWALLQEQGGTRQLIGQDDGEAGAADIIGRMMERAGLVNHVVVVTRWYGGVNLGGDRFRHIMTCVRVYLADLHPK